MSDRLKELLSKMRAGETVPAASWDIDGLSLQDVGLTTLDGAIVCPEGTQWLEPGELELATGFDVEVTMAVGSTNTEMMARASEGVVHKKVLLAEFQSEGRGRRGRKWFSPVARNLAMSIGYATKLPAYRLGGASLVVGLGVRRALSDLGAHEVLLKWPNDLLASAGKVCGILVEVTPGNPVQLVVGIGVNIALEQADGAVINQAASDLRALGVSASRSKIAARIVTSVIEHLNRFEKEGFAPMQAEYDNYHAFNGEDCRVLVGEEQVHGRVLGVAKDGQLRLLTPAGPREFSSGEVSLRAG